jgi:hypothetical protein
MQSAISSELSNTRTPKGFCPFSHSPTDGDIDALLALCLLKQPIAESIRVFSDPAKIPQWILLLSLNSKSSFYSLWHLLNALLAEYQESSDDSCFLRTHNRVLLCTPFTVSMPTWQSFTELLRASVYYMNSQQSSSSLHSLHLLNAHLAELYKTQREFMSATMFHLHSLAFRGIQKPPRYSSELMISVHVPTWHAFV